MTEWSLHMGGIGVVVGVGVGGLAVAVAVGIATATRPLCREPGYCRLG